MYGMNVVPSALLYVSLLFLIIVCQTLVWSILQSFLKLRAYAVSLYCVSFFNLIFLSAFLFLHYLGVDARSQNERMIFISVFLANLISLAIGIYCVLKDLGGRWSGRAKLWLPSGFWKFTSTLHINSLTLFFLMNTDQLVVLRYLGIKELGYYRVVLVLSSLVIWVPIVMDKVYYATFCNLTSDTARTEDAFLRFSRINILACSLVFIVIILFAAELTSLFGKSSLDANLPVLILLCGAKLLTVPVNMLNLALLTAHQKTFHTMIYYAIGALLSLYLFGAIVAAYGLLGAAIAYCIVQAVIFAVSLLLTKILLCVRFPVKKYLFSIATVAMASAAGLRFHAMGMENTGIKLCIVATFFGLTMALGLISIDDLRELIDWFVPSFVGRFLSRSKPS
jgi:O-antigen/teichoic acid export membrane protein